MAPGSSVTEGKATTQHFAAKPSEINRRHKGPLRSDVLMLGNWRKSINNFVSAIHQQSELKSREQITHCCDLSPCAIFRQEGNG